jgi:hypothetical protein
LKLHLTISHLHKPQTGLSAMDTINTSSIQHAVSLKSSGCNNLDSKRNNN